MYIQLLVTGGERQSEEVCTACCIWCSTWVSDVKPESTEQTFLGGLLNFKAVL